MSEKAAEILARALGMSRRLLAAADSGDSQAATDLDAQRLQLLKSLRTGGHALDSTERGLLREISDLNDKSIGLLEHHRRIKGRQLDTAAIGRRAVHAYATNRPLR